MSKDYPINGMLYVTPEGFCRGRCIFLNGLRKKHRWNSVSVPSPGIGPVGSGRTVDGVTLLDANVRSWDEVGRAAPVQNLFIEVYTTNPAVLVVVREQDHVAGFCGLPRWWELPFYYTALAGELAAVVPPDPARTFFGESAPPPAWPSELFSRLDDAGTSWMSWQYKFPRHELLPELGRIPSWAPTSTRAWQRDPNRGLRWSFGEFVEDSRNVALALGNAALAAEEVA